MTGLAVVEIPKRECGGSVPAGEDVLSPPADQDVIAGTAGELVCTIAAGDLIVERAARDILDRGELVPLSIATASCPTREIDRHCARRLAVIAGIRPCAARQHVGAAA